jgi:cytosine/adenosine deaminase-related metal-dependent hydrolase
MLQWATINGARALERDDVLGSFEPEKKPGIVWLDKALQAKKII